MEQKIIYMLGERDFLIAQQAQRIEDLEKENIELKAKLNENK